MIPCDMCEGLRCCGSMRRRRRLFEKCKGKEYGGKNIKKSEKNMNDLFIQYQNEFHKVFLRFYFIHAKCDHSC